jgi:hypothetical protein
MKQFLIVLVLLSTTCFAQDTIITVSGDQIPAIVKNINSTEIEYKKASNPDGPSYISMEKDIAAIHYRNGTSDVFPVVAEGPAKTDDYYSAGSAAATSTTSMNMSHVKAAPAIVFYGLDFTNFSLLEEKRMNQGIQIRDMFPDWNMYFGKEVPEKTISRWFRKSHVEADRSVVDKLNAQTDPSRVVASGPSYDNMYEKIKKSVASYASYDTHKEGIGLVMNVEYFDKRRLETAVYFTFFDIATHGVISSERIIVKKNGAGKLVTYWGPGLVEAMKDYVDKKYKYL